MMLDDVRCDNADDQSDDDAGDDDDVFVPFLNRFLLTKKGGFPSPP